MSDAAFALREFEHVEAIPGRALLRIAAEPTFDAGASTLILDGSERVRPLPAPPGPPGVARVAFSIPAATADATSTFALELADGDLVDLPTPVRRQGARTVSAGAGLGGPAPAPALPVDDGAADVIAELRTQLEAERSRRFSADTAAETSAAARAASETQLRSLDAELADARTVLAEARTVLADATAELDSTRGDLEDTRERLRNAQGEAELGQTRASHARAEAEAAESALIRRDAEIELLRQTLADRDGQAQSTYSQWEQITAELAAEVEVARQVAANFQTDARTLQLELADSRLELTSLRALREAHDAAVAAGSAADGDSGDPAVVAAKLNSAAAALEATRARAAEAETALAEREGELNRLRAQLPAAG